MARKYDCPQLRNDLLSRLAVDYPNSLDVWDRGANKGYTAIQNNYALPIDVIKVARENDFDVILPSAYFECISSYTAADILAGVPHDDQTVATLSSEDQAVCLAGLYEFHNAQLEHPFKWLSGPYNLGQALSKSCLQRKRCLTNTTLLATKFLQVAPHTAIGLKPWGRWNEKMAQSEKLCDLCWTEAKAIYEKGREELWEMLPSFFGLPTWEDMKAAQDTQP